VLLARDKTTGQEVALKFIERGPQVGGHAGGRGNAAAALSAASVHTPSPFTAEPPLATPQHIRKYVHREITCHMMLRHPHVVQLREVFLTGRHLVLAMEYAPGGDLYAYVRAHQRAGRPGLPEDRARWFFQQIVLAVDYCHRLGVSAARFLFCSRLPAAVASCVLFERRKKRPSRSTRPPEHRPPNPPPPGGQPRPEAGEHAA
jgi:serine/threonine protein kinase